MRRVFVDSGGFFALFAREDREARGAGKWATVDQQIESGQIPSGISDPEFDRLQRMLDEASGSGIQVEAASTRPLESRGIALVGEKLVEI